MLGAKLASAGGASEGSPAGTGAHWGDALLPGSPGGKGCQLAPGRAGSVAGCTGLQPVGLEGTPDPEAEGSRGCHWGWAQPGSPKLLEPRLSMTAATVSSLARGLGISALEQKPTQRGFALELELLAQGVELGAGDRSRAGYQQLGLAGAGRHQIAGAEHLGAGV